MAAPFNRLALAFVLLATPAFAADRPREITDTLALQEAMRNSRDLMVKGDYAKAVDLLEKQLSRTHGDPAYLSLLREAYSGYLKDLQLAGKIETVEVYRKRLAVLEKNSNKPAPAQSAPPAVAETSRGSIARGAAPEEDPFQQTPLADKEAGSDLLNQANQAFGNQKYEEAADLFGRASKLNSQLNQAQQSQYAYCLLNGAVAKINAATPPPAIESDVRAALAMSPKDSDLERFGQKLLRDLSSRGASGTSGIPMSGGPIKHSGDTDGSSVAESASFRLHHKQTKEAAEQILNLAEQHRAAAFAKWATTNPSAWTPTCDIYLYANGSDYAKATSQPSTAPGHSTIKAQGGKIVTRRMDLRADDVNFLGSVLPHEITHVVLGDLFVDQPLPRWADEGMAVLAEPRSQVDRYTRTLHRNREKGQLIPIASILSKSEYPDAAAVTQFYIESVSVVEFLVNQKGPAEFVAFMHDTNHGFDAALTKHYGFRNVLALDEAWRRATFTDVDRLAGR